MNAWTAIGAYVALIIGMLAIGAPAQQHGIVAGLWVTEALAITLPAVFALMLAGVRPGPFLGLRKLRPKAVIVAIVAAAANQPVVSFLTYLEHSILPAGVVADFDAKQRMLDAVFRANALPMVVTVTIAAPLGEELFFRGFAFPAITRSWGIFWGVVLSAILFSSLHMDLVGFVGLMEIGALLAVLRHWSGSLWAAVIGHAVNNGIAGAAFMMGYEDPDIPPPPAILGIGALLLIVGLVLAVRVLRNPSPAPAVEERTGKQVPAAAILGAVWIAALVWGLSAFHLPA